MKTMYIVIMAGGKGTRFWPRSRENTPKQLLDIIGERTMLQQTVDRVLPLSGYEKIIVVTNSKQVEAVKQNLPDIPEANIIVEPVGRNTAPCICLAATMIKKRDPEAVMAVLPADHFIGNAEKFRKALTKAAEAAELSRGLITIGIAPQGPETGYGYIQCSTQHGSVLEGVYPVTRFYEKPDEQNAREYIRRGFLWNSGMFVWHVSSILRELQQHLPSLYSVIGPFEQLWDTPGLNPALARAFESIEPISIDYGVLEKSSSVFTLKAQFGWNDIGSWTAIHALSPQDNDANALRGDVVAIDCGNSLVYSPGKLTAVVGMQDVIIVETDDALLVCHRDKVQDVRKVVEELEQRGRKEYL